MNIKGLNSNPISPIDRQARIDGETRMQSSTSDRDADGRRERPTPEPKSRLKQEEFDEAIKVLAEIPGLKMHNLLIRVQIEGEQRITFILDPDGQTVRRLTEAQLWSATRTKDRPTGSILNKAL